MVNFTSMLQPRNLAIGGTLRGIDVQPVLTCTVDPNRRDLFPYHTVYLPYRLLKSS